ncbi:acetylxylan esterase [Actinoplanes italicus]|uniref:Polysaccharide deacetylase n=1 Tax=Actinoplanes italicus TaxID=113567 RepID=A0A2T0K4M0_9ACTN|nr:polysaccharide deacetylase family protein [Actinoplanes italicus]PRX17646.1 polysaccharide deacetylase [Actinoplanes italicus]GIE34671.1 acetylxylan esterase [Actinoplanes italicus]
MWRRLMITGLAAVAAATGFVAAETNPAPSQAAACNGYVGLTFDDGPRAGNTQNLLAALRNNGLRATMFNQGQYAASNPALVRAQVDAGMWVANHSYTHPHMTQLSQAQMDSEISRTQSAISSAGGGTPRLFRPPYGETNSTLRAVQQKYGLTEIIWDVDSQDWNNASTDAIVAAAARLTNGQVILMHDWPANTVAAIPRIAQGLSSRGLCAGMISPSTGRAVAPDGGTTPTTPTTPPPGGGSCTATLSAGQTFGDRFNLNVAVSGSSNWTVTLNLNGSQRIQNSWNASVSGTSGSVTARPNGSGNNFGVTILANGSWTWPSVSCASA